MAQRGRDILAASYGTVRSAVRAAGGRIAPPVRRWWDNPLLHHARRLKPFPLSWLRRWLPVLAGGLALLSAAAWLADSLRAGRLAGAVLAALSIGAVVLPSIIAPVASADRVARQMRFVRQDPRRLNDLPPGEVTWGLALVTLWRLRWLIVVALAFTPALVIGVLRLDIVSFTAWSESAQALGGATEASRAVYLLPGGRVPYARLVIRALSAALLAWSALPLMATLGITAALRIDDLSFSPLAALLGGVVLAVLLAVAWSALSLTPVLRDAFEVVRALLLGALIAGISWLTSAANRTNARLLARMAGAGTSVLNGAQAGEDGDGHP